MHEKKGFKIFGERDIASTIKKLKHLDEEVMPGKPVVIPINPD